MIKCSICWEEKCPHFTVKTSIVEIEKKKLFGKNIIAKLPVNEITCYCGYTSQFEYKSNDYIFSCIICQFKTFISNNEINNNTLSKHFKTPRNKCIDCKGTGILKIPKFVACENCLGSGGQACLLCHQFTYLLSNRSSSNYTQDCIVDTCNQCHGSGWQNKCQKCKDRKFYYPLH